MWWFTYLSYETSTFQHGHLWIGGWCSVIRYRWCTKCFKKGSKHVTQTLTPLNATWRRRGTQFFSTLERSILFPCVKQDHWLNMSRSTLFYVTLGNLFLTLFGLHPSGFLASTPLNDANRLPQNYGQQSRFIQQTKSISVLGECFHVTLATLCICCCHLLQSNHKEQSCIRYETTLYLFPWMSRHDSSLNQTITWLDQIKTYDVYQSETQPLVQWLVHCQGDI